MIYRVVKIKFFRQKSRMYALGVFQNDDLQMID